MMYALNNKKQSPPLSDSPLVTRKKLRRQLNTTGWSLAAIEAPVGSGKTSAVIDWLLQESINFRWINLDRYDNALPRLWRYLEAALLSTDGPTRHDSSVDSLAFYIDAIDHAIANQEDLPTGIKPLTIVLDNYDKIHHQDIHRCLNYLVSMLPDHLRILVISRTGTRSLTQGLLPQKILEIHTDSLKFSDREAHQLIMNNHPGPAPNISQSKQINAAAFGYPQALIFIQQHQHLPQREAIDRGMEKIIVQILSETIQTEPRPIRIALLQIAPLPYFDDSICSDAAGYKIELPTFHQLVQDYPFLKSTPDYNGRYCFDPLFRNALLYQLKSTPSQYKKALLLAAKWLIAQGDISAGIDSAFLLKDWQFISELMERYRWHYINTEQIEVFQDWLDRLPWDFHWNNPALLCAQVWLLSDREKHSISDTMLDRARVLTDRLTDTAQQHELRTEILNLRAIVARLDSRNAEAHQLSKQALDSANHSSTPTLWRSYTTLGANNYTQGHLEAATVQLSKATQLASYEENLPGATLATGYLTESLLLTGRLEQATAEITQLSKLVQNHYTTVPEHLRWLPVCGQGILLETNRLEAAQNNNAQLLQFLDSHHCDLLRHLIIVLRWLELTFLTNDCDGAERALHQLNTLNQTIRFEWPYALGSLKSFRARLDAMAQNWSQLTPWLDAQWQANNLPSNFKDNVDRLIAAELMISRQRLEHAHALLTTSIQFSTTHQHWYHQMKGHVLLSLVSWQQGQQTQAINSILHVVEALDNQPYHRLFSAKLPSMPELLQATTGMAPTSSLLKQLVDASRCDSKSLRLSQREQQILNMVRSAHSDKEIAQACDIGLGTVKTHLRNIYRKLEVSSRIQAVNKANKLGLLEP